MISTAREYFTVDLRGLRAALAARAELAADIVDFVKGRPPRREIEQRPSRPEPLPIRREIDRTLERVQSIEGRDRKGPEIRR
jgi:hypothetical protein